LTLCALKNIQNVNPINYRYYKEERMVFDNSWFVKKTKRKKIKQTDNNNSNELKYCT